MPSRQAVFAAQDFLRAYESRSRERRLREDVDECVERFLANPRSPGLNFEKLSESDGIEVSSCRINVQYRLIVANDRRRFVLLYFDNHDEAYDWATGARKRIPRIVGSARTWTGDNAVVQSPTPHLDEDVPVPVESIASLGEMLANGMYAYIAHLDEVQRSYATSDFQRRNGSMFVRGGAGTGKTAIAIHRIAHLSAQQEIGRLGVLYLCFNNVLLKTVTEALRGLFGGSIPATIEARTFHAWAYAYLKDHAAEPKICQDNSVLNGDVRKAIEDEGLAMALG